MSFFMYACFPIWNFCGPMQRGLSVPFSASRKHLLLSFSRLLFLLNCLPRPSNLARLFFEMIYTAWRRLQLRCPNGMPLPRRPLTNLEGTQAFGSRSLICNIPFFFFRNDVLYFIRCGSHTINNILSVLVKKVKVLLPPARTASAPSSVDF